MQGAQGEQGIQGTQGTQGEIGTQGIQGHSDRYKTTSTTSRAIAVANNVSFVLVDADLSYSVGQDVVVAYDVNNNMSATVVSYTAGTNTLVVNVNDVRGSGTYAVWSINLDGATGVQGTQGIQGTQGEQGIQGVQGTDGIQGTTGTQGVQGISGTSDTFAATITPVSPYTTTQFNIDHNFGTLDVLVTVWDIATGAEVVTDITKPNTNRVVIGFAVAPASGETYRVVVKQ